MEHHPENHQSVNGTLFGQIRRHKVTTQFTLYNFLANILFLINDLIIGHVQYLIIVDCFVVLFYGSLYLYSRNPKNQEKSAILLAGSLNIWLVINADLYGKDSFIFLFLFTLSLMTFFLFDYKKKILFFSFLSVPAFGVFLLLSTNFSMFEEASFSKQEIETTAILSILGNLVLYYIFINGILRSVRRIEELFEIEQEKLMTSRIELEKLNIKISGYNVKLQDELEKAKQEIRQQQKQEDLIRYQGEENERKRISRELHDSLGVLLSTIKLSLEQTRERVGRDNLEVKRSIELIDKSISEVRYISQNLQPVLFAEFGLVKTLEDILPQVNELNKTLEIRLLNNGYTSQLNRSIELILFRVIMEQVNNIIRHAQASEAIIQLVVVDEHLLISIEDNGIGFEPQIPSKGLGLSNSLYRVQSLNGKHNIESKLGKGTLIQIEIPLP